jgi:hypothetical protein
MIAQPAMASDSAMSPAKTASDSGRMRKKRIVFPRVKAAGGDGLVEDVASGHMALHHENADQDDGRGDHAQDKADMLRLLRSAM